MKQIKGRKRQKLQKGNKERNKKEKTKNTVVKKEEKSMKERKEEETRKGMRRLAATDDPRPMSVSFATAEQTTVNEKMRKKGGQPGGENSVFKRECFERNA